MRRLGSLVPVAAVLAAAIIAGVVLYRVGEPPRRLVAQFTSAVGVSPGADVRVLGVRIGKVVSVTPQGRTIRIEMRYDTSYQIPADATAVIVPPSIVSDRYVQLTPAYTAGPALADGAELPVTRTAVPLEVDDVYRSLDALNRALGPSGANANGALSSLVATARANVEGNGAALHDALDGLSKALPTVSDGREDLFGTVANLADFTNALARSDREVAQFNQRLAAVSEQLAAEGDDLAAALHSLSGALSDIRTFVRDNRETLVSNVAALADITGVLARQQQALMQTVDVVPLALSNLNLAYNARSGTIDTRDNALGPYDPASYVCSLMVNLVPTPQIPRACFDLARMLAQRGLPLTNELRALIGLQAGTTPMPSPTPTVPAPDTIDRTLGGILRGTP